MKRILFINQEAGPLLIDIVNLFSSRKIQVTLLTGKVIPASVPISKRAKVTTFRSYKKNNTIQRLVTWSIFVFQCFFHLILYNKRYDAIWVSTNPPFAPFLAYIFRKNTFIHVYDVYPHALLSLKFIKKNSKIFRIFAHLNRLSYSKAKSVFTPSEGMKKLIGEFHDKDNVHIVNWWADTNFVRPIPKTNNKFAIENNIEDKFIVMYSGNIGSTHNIEKILLAAQALRFRKDIIFIIIGSGAKKGIVDKFKASNDLPNLLVLPFQSEKMLPFTLAAADIAVILDNFASNKSQGSTASIPSKTYYAMAAGSAIYAEADDNSELKRLIDKYDLGMCDSEHGITNLVKFIEICASETVCLNKFKTNARRASMNFTAKNSEQIYKIILEKS